MIFVIVCFPKTRNIDRAIGHHLDPDSEQQPRTLACARPKQDAYKSPPNSPRSLLLLRSFLRHLAHCFGWVGGGILTKSNSNPHYSSALPPRQLCICKKLLCDAWHHGDASYHMMWLLSIIFLIRWLYLNERISSNTHLIGKLPKIITSHDSFQSPVLLEASNNIYIYIYMSISLSLSLYIYIYIYMHTYFHDRTHSYPSSPRSRIVLLEASCDTWLYYTILYYIILYYTILDYTILYYTILYYYTLYYTILYYTILCYTTGDLFVRSLLATLGNLATPAHAKWPRTTGLLYFYRFTDSLVMFSFVIL